MSPTLIITKRELRSNFDTPIAYIVLCLTLPALAYAFFLRRGQNFFEINRASMTTLIELTSMLVVALSAILTMRVMADERRTGTLEMLITLPVKDYQVIIGKFLGTWFVVLAAIALTMLFPLMMFVWPWKLGNLDWGPVMSGYLGLVLQSAACVGIGMLVSSFTESQVIAFIVTAIILGFLHVTNYLIDSTDTQSIRVALDFVNFDSRITSLAQGLVTTRDILYFVSIAVLCLMGSFMALERRKWA
ncbi:MAG: ABC transporter permease subunit [Polyangiaceae bacterium]|nr:ABC transporter permease subunit [Polyangiaceae bacterium]